MAAYTLPLDSADPHYTLELDLEGSRFVAILDWNERDASWYFSLELPDGTQLLDGHRMVIGQPLLRRIKDSRRPKGDIILLDTSGEQLDAGRDELGGRVVALYYEQADLAALAA